jgi:hypothetical protein
LLARDSVGSSKLIVPLALCWHKKGFGAELCEFSASLRVSHKATTYLMTMGRSTNARLLRRRTDLLPVLPAEEPSPLDVESQSTSHALADRAYG